MGWEKNRFIHLFFAHIPLGCIRIFGTEFNPKLCF